MEERQTGTKEQCLQEEHVCGRDSQKRYVILGNGAAGFYAAKEIRKRDRTGKIVMISNEIYPPYRRTMLTKAMTSGISAGQMEMAAPKWYEEQQIELVLGQEVIRVDPVYREAELSDGSRFGYDRLIYALGSECFIPPIRGNTLPEVIAVRRKTDVEHLKILMEHAGDAAVIGGGILGLEAAWELKKAGLAVTVLEAAPVLMGRQLDESAGRWLRQAAAECGIEIRTGAGITSIDGEEHVAGVTLDGGEVIPADLVVISAGVRANTELAEKTGLQIRRGVVVNERMETNLQDIYACGDCAEYEGMNYAVWPQAVEQGKTAGANAAGEEAVYVPREPALTFQGMNTALFAAGDNGKDPKLSYKTMELQDPEKKQFRKYYFLSGRLCGVILLGDISDQARMRKLLSEHASYEEVTGRNPE